MKDMVVLSYLRQLPNGNHIKCDSILLLVNDACEIPDEERVVTIFTKVKRLVDEKEKDLQDEESDSKIGNIFKP